jgi:lipoprotein-releasing system permease protein
LNLEYFIAKRFLNKNKKNFSESIIKVSIAGIALGISVMILSVAVVTGFKQKISEKVIGFGGHIQIGNFDLNKSIESLPIEKNLLLENKIRQIKGVKNIQVFANKAGMIKTDNQIQGFILKGVDKDYDWDFIKTNLIEGNILQINAEQKSDKVIISKFLSDKLNLKLNDKLKTYFIEDENLRGRAFFIAGIYETGLEEFDKKIIFSDISHIQKLNKWNKQSVEGYEVLINDFDKLDEIAKEVYNVTGYNLNTNTIKEIHPEIFDWLSLTDMNVIVIIIIISMISSVTMISILLILILDKTNLIGLLKAMGLINSSIRKIFIYNALYIISKGMIIGNSIALLIGIIQIKFGIFKLDEASYYLKTIPVNLNLWHILLINTGTIILCIIALMVPSYIISKITPIKAIRYK